MLNYVSIYFIGTLIIFALADLRLIAPLLIWLAGYLLLMRYFVPVMGRVVDAYTNIQTVKLFSRAQRESTYAREGMDDFLVTVHRQMRLVTRFNAILYLLNSLLLLVFQSGCG